MDRIGSFVGPVISTQQSRLETCRKRLGEKQPTNGDWDNFYHFCTASHRTKPQATSSNQDAFEVNEADRAQVADDIQREVDRVLEDDIESKDPQDLPPPSPKKKRNLSPPSAPPGGNPDSQRQQGRSTSRASHSHQSNQAAGPS